MADAAWHPRVPTRNQIPVTPSGQVTLKPVNIIYMAVFWSVYLFRLWLRACASLEGFVQG